MVALLVGSPSDGRGFPGGSEVKNMPANAADAGSIPGSGSRVPCAIQEILFGYLF